MYVNRLYLIINDIFLLLIGGLSSLLIRLIIRYLRSHVAAGYGTYHLYNSGDSLTTVACSDGVNGLMVRHS